MGEKGQRSGKEEERKRGRAQGMVSKVEVT